MSDVEGKENAYGAWLGPYRQKSVRKRIEALFIDNVGKIVTREMILRAAKDPKTGREPENWHQRLSELRTDEGYTILSWRDRRDLRVEEYLMPTLEKRAGAGKRVRPTPATWRAILDRCGQACEWQEGGVQCGLREGRPDPFGGGTVRLTPDHMRPHSLNPATDPADPNQWQALCGRHQVMKKNFWDNATGKLNAYAIIQAAARDEKLAVFKFLLDYFGYDMDEQGGIRKK